MSATTTAPRTGLRIGPIEVAAPVVLAPMAGITNAAYRQLCREQAEAGRADLGADAAGPAQLPGSRAGELRRNESTRFSSTRDDEGAGFLARSARSGASQLFVCEMITSRGLVEGDRKTLNMLQFDPGEQVRSVQLYGVDPATMGRATEILIGDHGVDHVDLNFGCPVPKVTRKGGGAALPYKRERLRLILEATVGAASRYGVPVTMKTRIGIDDTHHTYLDAGRIADQAGCAAIALHGRTAQQAYAGHADWSAIARLKQHVSLPVLGNGDIWELDDAREMMAQTGADGVVVGRGCLGRPWLFRDLARLSVEPGRLDGGPRLPSLGEVAATVRRHAELLAGLSTEEHGLTDLRKHMAWYFKGFPVGGDLRRAFASVSSLAELDDLLGQLDHGAPFPVRELGTPRGRQGTPRYRVALPEGWLDDPYETGLELSEAEVDTSGG